MEKENEMSLSNNLRINSGRTIILFIAWILMQSYLLYTYGIVTRLEAYKYIEQANNIINYGTVSTPNFWLYSTQIFIIALAIKLKAGFLSVALFQIFLNGLATTYFYKFLNKISNAAVSLILTLFLILNFPFQSFNTYLQTESIFFSITIIFSCYLLGLQKLTAKDYLLLMGLLILICITKPTGLLFIPASFLYLFFRFFTYFSPFLKIMLSGAILIIFLILLNTALGSGGELNFMLPFRKEMVICGVPTVTYPANIKTTENPNSIIGLLYYVIHNSEQFIRLAWMKTKEFFGLYKNHYSTLHNIYLVIYFFPFYLLVALSIPKWLKENKNILLYCIVCIGITWLTILFTCDDWHNRFFLPLVPYIYILSIPFLQTLITKCSKK